MYGLMIAIGFLLSLYLLQRDFEKKGVDTQLIGNMAFWVLILGIVGARLLHIIKYPEFYSWSDPVEWIAIWHGGLIFQGALPLPILYVWWEARRHNVNFRLIVDVAVTYIPLAHAFGRLGCFFNGCCYGKMSHVPWAISFPRVPWDVTQPPVGSPPYLDHIQRFSTLSPSIDHWSLPVHPTQLYGIVGLLLLFVVMHALRKYWNPFQGFVLPAYLVLYGVGRFLIEFYRGDNKIMFAGLTDQQVFSVVFVAVGVVLFLLLRGGSAKKSAAAKSA